MEYLEEELKDLAEKEGISDKINFITSCSTDERNALLSECLCVLYTPENKHFGVVPLEAMAAYRPVIACNSGGPVESFKNGVTDSLFKLMYRIVFACTTVFLWRASKDIIPTKMNLRKKGMCVDTSCPFYHSENEDTAHLLIHCHFARQVWSASVLGCRIPAGSNILDWIATNLQTNDEYGAQVCCYLMWKIWGARNKVEFKQLSSLPIEVATDALNALLDFTTANASQSKVKKLQFHTSLPSAQKVEVLCTLLQSQLDQ